MLTERGTHDSKKGSFIHNCFVCIKKFLAQRKVNKEISKEKRKRMEAIWKEMEEPPTNTK
ncbi:hypothetical protein BY458DRAFT_512358 [Sporodiniella umbellata]|nr:hypothetical protein BY458DRAFT_512358 [Sporodiniella umbellata]